MDSAAHYLSKNVYFNICRGKNSKVTAVDYTSLNPRPTKVYSKRLKYMLQHKTVATIIFRTLDNLDNV